MAEGHHEPNAFEHTADSEHWHFFDYLTESPQLWKVDLGFYELQITKFMLLELIAAAILIAVFVPIARRSQGGQLPKGRWWNWWDAILTFLREQVAKPCFGHDADKFVPYLWTVFLFILICNLLGMIPFMGSPTASIAVTGALALCSFVLFHAVASVKLGPITYLKSLWPKIDAPGGVLISALIWGIEMLGTFIKGFVLAVRLFANIFAGHVVLAMILTFVYQVHSQNWVLWSLVTLSSVIGVVALSLLELFIAFLQAYVFTYLTALFIGMSLHHDH